MTQADFLAGHPLNTFLWTRDTLLKKQTKAPETSKKKKKEQN